MQSGLWLQLTARQYGEVVLPDASTGQNPGTLAKKLSRCKEGMACVFAVMVQILLRTGAIAVQFWSEPRIYPRLQIWWRALAQYRGTNYLEGSNLSRCRNLNCVQMRVSGCMNHYKFVLSAGVKAKTVTNNLPILSVLAHVMLLLIKS
jgi:hypothetical protein